MTVPLAFAIFTLSCSAALLFAEHAQSRPRIWLWKPLAALGYIATAIASGALGHVPGRVLVFGMLLAAIGDVLLIKKEDKRWFLRGITVFMLGHFAYVASFVLRGIDPRWTVIGWLVFTIPALAIGRALVPRAGKLGGAVISYIVVLTAMVATSMGLVSAGGSPFIAGGAFLFYLSDLFVARERFVSRSFVNKLFGQPLYFGGQLVLAIWGGAP